MPTKTERILSYLPSTFRAGRAPSALRSVVDAFGGELLAAENSLAAVMRAHWVDHADRGADEIDDLARIAALYGLAPRPDESVEEFREHLKRFIRIFLEGTVTVQGVARIAAEVLGLRIADAYEDMDTWWTRRPTDLLETRSVRLDDAAALVVGSSPRASAGADAGPARVRGNVDLSAGVDLRDAAMLRVRVDGAGTLDVDLAAGAADPAAVSLAEIIAAITAVPGAPAPTDDGGFLVLASPTMGASSGLAFPDRESGAAESVLGLGPLRFTGADAEPARVVGAVDLGAGVDLRERRFLRLLVDRTHLAEVDCAGADPGATTLDEVAAAIDGALGIAVASHDGRLLTVTAPTAGVASSVAFETPAAQDARELLFGVVAPLHLGEDGRPARLTGTRDLSAGVDLRDGSIIRLAVDGGAAIAIDVAGADPGRTSASEIVAAVNTALGTRVATTDTRLVTLASPTVGAGGEVVIDPPPDGDATEAVLGLLPSIYRGADARAARVVGEPDLDDGVDLTFRRFLSITVDDAHPARIDITAGASEPRNVRLGEIVDALNAALEGADASHDGGHLILTSRTAGSASRLEVKPLARVKRRRFVTRARVTSEAATRLLGFDQRVATGEEATAARVSGDRDLYRGVDVRQDRYLRMAIDDRLPRDIDCAGPRPRATTVEEVVRAINDAIPSTPPVASSEGGRLRLASPTSGAGSRIVLEAPRSTDALERVLGVAPSTYGGEDATGVRLVGTIDLSGGAALPAGAAIRLAVDGGAPVEVVVAEAAGTRRLDELITAINTALGMVVAQTDGARLLLESPTRGGGSRLDLLAPIGPDATAVLLGIVPPRAYRGADARAARVEGRADLSASVDLSVARFMRVAIDAGAVVEVDCAGGAGDVASVRPEEIAAALDAALGPGVAVVAGDRLSLTSPTAGRSSRITLEPVSQGDARPVLFGAVPDETRGAAAAPAVIDGEVDLLAGADLSHRSQLALIVDDAPATEIDVAGADPAKTSLAEVVAAINRVVPGLAGATAEDRLRLQSPTTGANSRLEVQPVRYLEVREYPPESEHSQQAVRHANRWILSNRGAAESPLEVEIMPRRGVFAPSLVRLDLGLEVRLRMAVVRGERASIWWDGDRGARAVIASPETGTRAVPSDLLHVRTLRGQPVAPGTRVLSVPRGRSTWLYRDCLASRFDEARFDEARFAGEPCVELGVFDVSRFAVDAPEAIAAVFAPSGVSTEPSVDLLARWESHQPGAFEVNLPADLPPRFGGRFDTARFGAAEPEQFDRVVTEPVGDPRFIADVVAATTADAIGAASNLIRAGAVGRVPLGFEGHAIPFRQPRSLTLGDDDNPARLYLAEDGSTGFIEIRAIEPGAWGNEITVAVRPAGPGRFDLIISYAGARFENARRQVLGVDPLSLDHFPARADELGEASVVGVLQAKAAGVEVRVTRDRAG